MVNYNRLKGRIMEAGYTRKEFADMLGINENTLTSRLKGRSSFRVDEVTEICKLLHIKGKDELYDIFFGGEEPKMAKEYTE